MKRFVVTMLAICAFVWICAQERVYDESVDPFVQIDEAVKVAKETDRFVVCQLGGNWCSWCVLFAKFIRENPDIDKIVNDNFVYIHVNFKSRRDELSQKVSRRLGNAGRFGFPVLVVLNTDGSVLHIQNSSYLEEGKGYDKGKVLDFFKQWTPAAVRGE